MSSVPRSTLGLARRALLPEISDELFAVLAFALLGLWLALSLVALLPALPEALAAAPG
ncbi:MAG TPA: hypothetical protein VFA50_15805 [Stellaceae bacterium]|nr:hypothetical protein [Stellaceae bacterium]